MVCKVVNGYTRYQEVLRQALLLQNLLLVANGLLCTLNLARPNHGPAGGYHASFQAVIRPPIFSLTFHGAILAHRYPDKSAGKIRF
jgi:hypothetical protein